ncbi:Hypothetical protein SCF082_LOCUS8573 [Durusdinium trenchii]|uniref:Uncharacterized protein n=1 Tax=Durusdinium trenchii TaxID=1381693 RepID=A0ABP0IS19_9DINO
METEKQELEKGVLRARWIGPEPEEALLRAGLLGLSEAIGTGRLLEFPRRANGTPLLTRQGFFERLLKGETSFLNCAAADASAAEADVKRLALHQLLAIRCQNLEWNQSAAKGLGSKASFLSLVDRCTIAQLGQRLFGQEIEALSDAHRALLLRHIVLIYGAARSLASDAGATVFTSLFRAPLSGGVPPAELMDFFPEVEGDLPREQLVLLVRHAESRWNRAQAAMSPLGMLWENVPSSARRDGARRKSCAESFTRRRFRTRPRTLQRPGGSQSS